MSGTRFVVAILGVTALAAVGCTSRHSGDSDDAGGGGAAVHSGDASSASMDTTDPECMLHTTAPRMFPTDGPCDDSDAVRGVFSLTPTGHYLVTCDPQPLDVPGCKGLPNDSWNKCALRRCAPRVSYPPGCNLATPTGNPHFGGVADSATCTDPFEKGKFQWVFAG